MPGQTDREWNDRIPSRKDSLMKRLLTVAGLVVAGLVVLAASTHAAAGAGPHGMTECLACGVCEWLNTLLT